MQNAPKRHLGRLGSMLISILCLSAASSFGQSLGEVSHQERARKQSQPSRTVHVYTNEDMTRPQILVPEDQARFRAAREAAKPTLAQQDGVPVALPQPAEIPLGDVARYLLLQEELRSDQPLMGLPRLSVAPPSRAPADIPLGDVARHYRLQSSCGKECPRAICRGLTSRLHWHRPSLPGRRPCRFRHPWLHRPSRRSAGLCLSRNLRLQPLELSEWCAVIHSGSWPGDIWEAARSGGNWPNLIPN